MNVSLITPIDRDSFKEEVLEAEQLVLINFHTDDCGPCKAMEPVLKELSEQYGDTLKIVTFYISLDEVLENSNEIAVEYDVMGFPTVLLMRDGHVVSTLLGGQLKEDLVREIEVALS